MITKYFVDSDGKYLGGFDGAKPPAGSIEVPNPPNHGTDNLVNGQWVKAASRNNSELLAQISALESKQARATREAILTGDTTHLNAIESEIAILRGQLA